MVMRPGCSELHKHNSPGNTALPIQWTRLRRLLLMFAEATAPGPRLSPESAG